MEEQYDIRFDHREPSSADIAAHQDFEALMAAFGAEEEAPEAKVVPLRTRRWPVFVAAAAVALLVLSYPLVKGALEKPLVNETEFFASRPFVDPPATANVPDLTAEIIIDPEQEQRVALSDGQLVLSNTALFRDRGKSIGKPVQVHYRQMDEVATYFLAGIPLQYEEADQQTVQLDAAVVLDVYATAAGNNVDIAEGQQVAVELNTTINNAGTDYRVYRLDTVSRRWIDAGELAASQVSAAAGWPETAAPVLAYRALEAEYDARIAAEEQAARNGSLPERPTPPQREIGNNPTLELDFLNQVSLAAGSDVSPADLERLNSRGIWELLPETGNIDVRAFNVEWANVRLRRLPNEKYELTLINPQRQEQLIIRPILLDDGNFLEAQQRYEQELAAYESALAAAAQNDNNDRLAALKREKAKALAQAEVAVQDFIEAMPAGEQQRLQNRRANFRFNISSWGIYAVARQIQNLPQLTTVRFNGASPGDEEGKSRVYYTDGKHKTLYRGLLRNENARLPLSGQETSARIWVVDEHGTLRVTEQETLPTDEQNNVTLQLKKAGPLPSSSALLRQRLVLD